MSDLRRAGDGSYRKVQLEDLLLDHAEGLVRPGAYLVLAFHSDKRNAEEYWGGALNESLESNESKG